MDQPNLRRPAERVVSDRPFAEVEAALEKAGRVDELIRLYEDLAATAGVFPRPRTAGIALNTGHLDPAQAARAVASLADETGLAVTDVLRTSAAPLVDAIGLGGATSGTA